MFQYFEGMNDKRNLCVICCDKIDSFHKFREKCLETKNILIAQLHSTENVTNTHDFIDINSIKIQGESTKLNEINDSKNKSDENIKDFHLTKIKIEKDVEGECSNYEYETRNISESSNSQSEYNTEIGNNEDHTKISTEQVIIKMETNSDLYDENNTSNSEDLQEGKIFDRSSFYRITEDEPHL